MHRYLTKLSDQVICLMSKVHSDAIVWGEGQNEKSSPEKMAHSRLYAFEVQKTKEQEGVSVHHGFKVCVGGHLCAVHFFLMQNCAAGNSDAG